MKVVRVSGLDEDDELVEYQTDAPLESIENSEHHDALVYIIACGLLHINDWTPRTLRMAEVYVDGRAIDIESLRTGEKL